LFVSQCIYDFTKKRPDSLNKVLLSEDDAHSQGFDANSQSARRETFLALIRTSQAHLFNPDHPKLTKDYEERSFRLGTALAKAIFGDVSEYLYVPPFPVSFNNTDKGRKDQRRHIKRQQNKSTLTVLQCMNFIRKDSSDYLCFMWDFCFLVFTDALRDYHTNCRDRVAQYANKNTPEALARTKAKRDEKNMEKVYSAGYHENQLERYGEDNESDGEYSELNVSKKQKTATKVRQL
jgi:hypothetical protein